MFALGHHISANCNVYRRSGFGRQSNKGNGNGTGASSQQKANGSASSSPTGYAPSSSQMTTSPYAQPATAGSDYGLNDAELEPEPPKFFFREKYAKLGVKGSFMPLAVRPIYVDMGDWLAHHCEYQVNLCIYQSLTTPQVTNNTAFLNESLSAFRKLTPIPAYPSVTLTAAP